MIQLRESKDYYINSMALTFSENDLDNPNRVAVSMVSGTVIMVHIRGTIDYASDGNFERWKLKGYSTKLATNNPYYIYARLNRTSPEALIVFSINHYTLDGSIDGAENPTPSDLYWYVRIGYISGTDGFTDRELTYDSGILGTMENTNKANDLLSKAFVFHFDDESNPNKLTSIQALAGLWTESYLSALGKNEGKEDEENEATTLGGLKNVANDANQTFDVAKMLVLEADSNLWTLKNLSELVGLDEDALAEYLTNNEYAKKGDIPSLGGYATEQWVLGKGYLTEHQDLSAYAKQTDIPTKVSEFDNDANYATTSDLDARIDALVNGAPAAYDTLKEIADVLAGNINSIDDILTALGTKVSQENFDTVIADVNKSITDLNDELGLKLDASVFNELFEKVQLKDGTWAIKAKLGLFSDGFISALGSNPETGSGGGALYALADVRSDGAKVEGAVAGAVLMYDGDKWYAVSQREFVPDLTGYATESWVKAQGYLTQHQDLTGYAKLTDIPTIPTADINKGVTAYGWGDHSKVGYLKGITSALVTDALGYTPYDSAGFTKANIKSTLGISDWALAASKPTYKTSEVTEDTNLYFTNARAVNALKGVTDGLGTAIATLQDHFTDGVAKSALKLADDSSFTVWGQSFFANGKPKSVSGALTDVTDIASSGTITTNKIVIGNGTIEWDPSVNAFKVTGGLYTDSFLSALGLNPDAGSEATGVTKLSELEDISLSSLSSGQSLVWNGTSWTNQEVSSGFDEDALDEYLSTNNYAKIGDIKTALNDYQPLITSTNKLAYSLISGTPASLKNPYSLAFGSKTYDGSAARTILASDLGALTSHQAIHALTIKNSAGTTQLTYIPNSAAGSLTLTKAMVGLGNVENTALSTWIGTNKITTLGTITTGVWNGSKIANGYLANSAVTIAGASVSLGGSITAATLKTNLGLGGAAYKDASGTWEISITGNAATASNASNADKINGYNIVVGSAGTDPKTIYFVT